MKKKIFIVGHYGSGKSEFTVNFSLNKKAKYIVDLDIINPYFRTRELKEVLEKAGITLISSSVENSLGSDLPYISKRAFDVLRNNELVLYDLGGDDVGARVLKQFKDKINPAEVEVLFCLNVYREETSTPTKILKMIEKIEESSGFLITGLINNSNFIRDTTYTDIKEAETIVQEVGEIKNLKIVYTGVYENILDSCGFLLGEKIPLQLYLRQKWL